MEVLLFLHILSGFIALAGAALALSGRKGENSETFDKYAWRNNCRDYSSSGCKRTSRSRVDLVDPSHFNHHAPDHPMEPKDPQLD